MAIPETKLAKTEEQQANALTVPGQPIVAGVDALDSTDFTIPRVRLLQSVSAEVQEGLAKPGTLKNSLTDEEYGEKLDFVPVLISKARLRFCVKELRCRSNDGITGVGDPGGSCAECSCAQWGANGEPPECAVVYNYPSIILDANGQSDGMPVAVSLMRTSTPAAKRLNTMIKFDPKGSVYELSAEKRENEKGKFYVFSVRKKRALTAEERQGVLELRQMLAGKRIEVDQDAEDAFVDASEDAPAAGVATDDDQPF
ncbi:MAG: hypothetical protein ACM3X3_01625 [Betaproteobacteria bacterium]